MRKKQIQQQRISTCEEIQHCCLLLACEKLIEVKKAKLGAFDDPNSHWSLSTDPSGVYGIHKCPFIITLWDSAKVMMFNQGALTRGAAVVGG